MEKKSLVLSIKLASLFEDKEDRIKFGFKFNEKFEARKLDKKTGEFVITTDNELSFTKKQFVFNLRENFVINLMATNIKFEHILPTELLAIFKDAKLTVDRTRLEEGDTYVDIDSEEQTSEATMFLTEIKDIKFTEKNITAIKAVIIRQTKPEEQAAVTAMLDLIL